MEFNYMKFIPLIIFIILGIVFLIQFTKIRIRGAKASSLIFKTLTSCCFVGIALSAVWMRSLEGRENGYGFLVLAGLFAGLLGDIFLDLKYNIKNESDRYTFAGFWSFAVGHILFLAALIGFAWDRSGVLWVLIPLIAAAALGIMIGNAGKLLGLDFGKFRNITMIYASLLIATTLTSGSLYLHSEFLRTNLLVFFIGAILFLVSDLILSGTYFGEGKSRPADIIFNHVFYYGGQFLIAASLLL